MPALLPPTHAHPEGLDLLLVLFDRVDTDEGDARVVENEYLGELRVTRVELDVRALAAKGGKLVGHVLCNESDVELSAAIGATETVVPAPRMEVCTERLRRSASLNAAEAAPEDLGAELQ